MYEIIPRYQTREQALAYLRNKGITLELDDRVIICRDDLGGLKLIKIGKTEVSTQNRQIDYARALNDLYTHDLNQRQDYEITFVARLSEIEAQVKECVFTEKHVGLVRDDGTVCSPKEVFLVESIEQAQCDVKETIEKIQIGRPLNDDQVDEVSQDMEVVKLNQMKETTRQLELKVNIQTMQLQSLQLLERMGATKDDLIKVITAGFSSQ